MAQAKNFPANESAIGLDSGERFPANPTPSWLTGHSRTSPGRPLQRQCWIDPLPPPCVAIDEAPYPGKSDQNSLGTTHQIRPTMQSPHHKRGPRPLPRRHQTPARRHECPPPCPTRAPCLHSSGRPGPAVVPPREPSASMHPAVPWGPPRAMGRWGGGVRFLY